MIRVHWASSFGLWKFVFPALLIAFAANPLVAQEAGWRDEHGNQHIVPVDQLPKTPVDKSGRAKVNIKAVSGPMFTVAYDDITTHSGQGFDDPVLGATRRATLEAVFSYISSNLSEPGSCDVEMRVSTTSGNSSFLAFAQTTYFSNDPVFSPGVAFEHLHNNLDRIPAGAEIKVIVDFGYEWNSGLGTPGASENDLFSVLLHEVTHGLGINSSTDAAGKGLQFQGGIIKYTTFENLLYTGNGTKIWNASGQLSVPVNALTGGQAGVFFRGARATQDFGAFPPIYAPSPFEDGSSIGHWKDDMNPHPVMEPALLTGSMRRKYQPFELSALRDIGYRLKTNAVADWNQFE